MWAFWACKASCRLMHNPCKIFSNSSVMSLFFISHSLSLPLPSSQWHCVYFQGNFLVPTQFSIANVCMFALQIYHYNDMTFEQAASHKLTYIYRIFGAEVAKRVWHLVLLLLLLVSLLFLCNASCGIWLRTTRALLGMCLYTNYRQAN